MRLFKPKKDYDLNKTIVDYVNSILPPSVYCLSGESTDEKHYITICNNSRAVKIEFEVDGVHQTYQLTDADKDNISVAVIVQILKALDKELCQAHEDIQKTLTKIESTE
jgi:histidyl-tRNA synthetase